MSHSTDLDQEDSIKLYSVPVSIGLVILGLVMLIGGGTMVVDNAISIAKNYGLSDKAWNDFINKFTHWEKN